MRVWIGFVVAVALVAAPAGARGQQGANAPSAGPWLLLQLDEPADLRVPSSSRPSLAYIPEHLKKRLPQYRHPTPASVEEATPQRKPEREIEIEYVTPGSAAEGSGSGLSRPARIAIGVVVPLVVLTGTAAAATVSAFNNMFDDL